MNMNTNEKKVSRILVDAHAHLDDPLFKEDLQVWKLLFASEAALPSRLP
jgi:hypothetical protein